MNLVVSSIPEDTVALGAWLERHLVGLELAQLIGELQAIHSPLPESLSVESVLAGRLEEVYQSGLSGLPRELLRKLLTQPSLLFELQELVLTHGGPFWDEVARRNQPVEAIVERGWERLLGVRAPAAPPIRQREGSLRKRWFRRALLGGLAAAAIVVAAVSLWQFTRPPARLPVAWGWARPDALPENVSREEYLETLANEAGEWFNKRPETAEALGRRIDEFRQGCSSLLQANHRPLPEADRQWLVERCRKWAEKLDRNLADLQAGKDVEAVRWETDATINQLIRALRQRAL
jgi:hypothetical protein